MLNKAIEKASEHVSGGRCSIYALALDKRGRVISEGGNLYTKTSPRMAEASRKAGQPHRQFLHAEAVACIRAKGKRIHKLVIARLDRNGNIGYAKPCPCCSLLISEVEKTQGNKIEIVHT